MGKADLHIHSGVSDGMASVAEIMEYAQEHTDLDVVSITDHDQVAGSLQAVEWVARHPGTRLQVVVGTEITTALGRHLLAYFFRPPYPTEPFQKLRSYHRTIDMVHSMGGVVAIPHPTVMWTPSGGYRFILRLLRAGVTIEALEVFNAAPGARGSAEKVRLFNRRDFHLAELGGSDAHHMAQIGSGYTFFHGRSAQEFQKGLILHKLKPHWGTTGSVSVQQHAAQVFKSWIEKPTRGLRESLAGRAAVANRPTLQ